MGIVNVTPDSFSDGGRFASTARRCALREAARGRRRHPRHRRRIQPPGHAPPVPLEEELARVLPLLREAVTLGVPVSVDTYKPEVMREALDLGADIVNDIWALRQPGAEAWRAHPGCGVCLMHMHGEPQTMQRSPLEGDAVPQVLRFLRERSEALRAWASPSERIVLGPGHRLRQDRGTEFRPAGAPARTAARRLSAAGRLVAQVLAGHGHRPAGERAHGPSVAAALLAVDRGARIVRVHDVRKRWPA
jgi:dihydropteroate synthase